MRGHWAECSAPSFAPIAGVSCEADCRTSYAELPRWLRYCPSIRGQIKSHGVDVSRQGCDSVHTSCIALIFPEFQFEGPALSANLYNAGAAVHNKHRNRRGPSRIMPNGCLHANPEHWRQTISNSHSRSQLNDNPALIPLPMCADSICQDDTESTRYLKFWRMR